MVSKETSETQTNRNNGSLHSKDHESCAACQGILSLLPFQNIPKFRELTEGQQFKEKYEINEIPVPQIGDNDLLVKIGAASFCHTDYQVWEGVYESPLPVVPSHEPVGTVVAVGAKAQDKWKVGQRVGVLLFKHQCHHCASCKAGNDIRFCENVELAGLKNDGGMAEYMVADAENTVLLPDSVSFEQAAPLLCAGVSDIVEISID